MAGDLWVLKGSNQVLENVHKDGDCLGEWCTIHRPMPGPWENWQMRFIANIVMARICPCGYAHPAIEDVLNGRTYRLHKHYCDCDCGVMDFREYRGTISGP